MLSFFLQPCLVGEELGDDLGDDPHDDLEDGLMANDLNGEPIFIPVNILWLWLADMRASSEPKFLFL